MSQDSDTAFIVADSAQRATWENSRRAARATTSVLTLALTALAVSAAGGPDDLLMGTPFHGRGTTGDQQTVGYFARTLIVRTRVRPATTFGELIDTTTYEVRSALALSDTPYEQLTGDIHAVDGGHVVWVVTYGAESLPQLSGLAVEPVPIGIDGARHDLRIALADHGTRLELGLTHRRRAVHTAFADRVVGALELLLRRVPGRAESVAEIMNRARVAGTAGTP